MKRRVSGLFTCGNVCENDFLTSRFPRLLLHFLDLVWMGSSVGAAKTTGFFTNLLVGCLAYKCSPYNIVHRMSERSMENVMLAGVTFNGQADLVERVFSLRKQLTKVGAVSRHHVVVVHEAIIMKKPHQ